MAAPLGFAAAAMAQDGPMRQLSFEVAQRFEATSNQSLTIPAEDSTFLSSTRLSFGFVSETALDRLSLSVSGVVRAGSGPGFGDSSVQLDDRRLSLGYSHSAASGEIGIDATLRDADISFLRPLEDFVNSDTGEIELPEDFEDLEGTGTRRSTSISGRLRFGDDARVGATLKVGQSRIDYIDASAALNDIKRLSYGADIRFSINEATSAKLSLGQQDYTSADTTGTRVTRTLGISLSSDFANGSGSLSLLLSDKATGFDTRSVTFGRSFETTSRSFAATLGVTQAGDNTNLTGSLRFSQELPRGTISLRLNRAVTTAADDTDRLTTLLAAGYSQDLGPNGRLGLNVSWAESRTTGGATQTINSNLGATYSHALTENWSLDTGLTHRSRDEDGSGTAKSNSVFIGLSRNWQ